MFKWLIKQRLAAFERQYDYDMSYAREASADAFREEIERRWGPRAVVSLAFAMTLARVYPTLKYALGHGRARRRVIVEGAPIAVMRGAA